MSRHFRLRSELSGAIAEILPHAKNQLSVPGSFFNQFITDIYYIGVGVGAAGPALAGPLFWARIRWSGFWPDFFFSRSGFWPDHEFSYLLTYKFVLLHSNVCISFV